MAFCHQCGTALEEGVRFCGSCGSASDPATKPGTAPPDTASPSTASNWTPPSPNVSAHETKSIAGLGTALQWLFGIIAALFAISAVIAIGQRSKIVDISDDVSLNPFGDAQDAESALSGIGGITFFVGLAIFILLIIWTSRGYKNIAAFGVTKYRLGTGMAVGAWFIPFYNMGGPKQIMNDTWRASEPGSDITSGWTKRSILPITSIWWIGYFVLSTMSFVGYAMVTNDSSGFDEPSIVGSQILRNPDVAANGITLYAAASLGLTAISVLGLMSIRKITERHELKRSEIAQGSA